MNVLSAKAVSAKTSLSVPHIRRAAKKGIFPQPVKLSEARLGWLEDDIDKWVSALDQSKQEETDNA